MTDTLFDLSSLDAKQPEPPLQYVIYFEHEGQRWYYRGGHSDSYQWAVLTGSMKPKRYSSFGAMQAKIRELNASRTAVGHDAGIVAQWDVWEDGSHA